MEQKQKFRLNMHDQVKGYYTIFFSGEYELRPVHTSLYMFLLNQNNRANWVEWFKCPYDLAMMGAGINSKTTYYKVLDDLVKFGLIEYKPGLNSYKAPQISIKNLGNSVPKNEQLTGQVTVPLSEQVTGQLTVPLSGNIIRLITDNLKLVTDNLERWIFEEKQKEENDQKEPYKIKELHTPQKNLFDDMLNFFSIRESIENQDYRILNQAIWNVTDLGMFSTFKQQFYSYKAVKESNNTHKHGVRKYIGTYEKKYQDGVWFTTDWTNEAKRIKPNNPSESPTRGSFRLKKANAS